MSRNDYVFNDARVLKWIARYSVTVAGKKKDYYVPTHECTEADFARFR